MAAPSPPGAYYHAFDPGDWLFRHNVQVGSGRLVSLSYGRASGDIPEGAMSPYEAHTTEGRKEAAFERIRAAEFPDRPTRLGSVFLFPDRDNAARANELWWGNGCVLLPAVVLLARRAAILDCGQLNAPEPDWTDAAHAYWGGVQTAEPFLEIVVEGVIQLEGWEPYGHIGLPPS